MRIKLTSIMVDDQDKALKVYTEVFGFVKKHEIPVGEYRWLTVVSPQGRDDLELSLEPNANPAGRTFQEAMFKQGIPIAAFEVDDIDAEWKRLKASVSSSSRSRRRWVRSASPSARTPAATWCSSINRHGALDLTNVGGLAQQYRPASVAGLGIVDGPMASATRR